jgi:hypothetical protein
MYTRINFKLISPDANSNRILELFLKDWIDDTSIQYTFEHGFAITHNWRQEEIYSVDFEHIEDALVIKLKGVPPGYIDYIQIVY